MIITNNNKDIILHHSEYLNYIMFLPTKHEGHTKEYIAMRLW